MKERTAEVDRIRCALDRALGVGAYPGQLSVDLDDLQVTLESAGELVRKIAESPGDRAEMLSRLHALQITIEQDLPWIFQDVLPMIKKVRGDEG